MRKTAIFSAWWRILRGYRPFLSIEITKACPLRCPGCYAYDLGHLNGGRTIRDLAEWRGEELVTRVLSLVARLRPLHVSIVGGEPLVRTHELTSLFHRLDKMGIEIQVVTSAVCPIPREWAAFSNLHLVVSVDGLQPEHDARRAPATYDRIVRNMNGHHVVIHCTITPRLLARPDYLAEFAHVWSARSGVTKIWFSLFTPQIGDFPPERLSATDRSLAIDRIAALRSRYPKVYAPGIVLQGYSAPPAGPSECIFAQTTTCLSVDLSTPVTPCQIGGQPDCSECGCIAGAGFAAIGRFKLAGVLKVSDIFAASNKLGAWLRNVGPG